LNEIESQIDSSFRTDITSLLNDCAINTGPEVGKKELFFHVALSIESHNNNIVKNLAYLYDNHDFHSFSISLYEQSIQRNYNVNGGRYDLSLLLSSALVCPSHLSSIEEGMWFYDRMISRLDEILHLLFHSVHLLSLGEPNPINFISGFPQGWSYLARPFSPLIEKLSIIFSLIFHPTLYPEFQFSSDQKPGEVQPQIRLGVVGEKGANTSPGNLIERVLSGLVEEGEVHLTFFDYPPPHSFPTTFSSHMAWIAHEVETIDPTNLTSSQLTIQSCNLDLLLYLSLPYDRFIWLLGFIHWLFVII